MIHNKTKHNKYSQDWQNNLKWLSNPLEKTDQDKLNQDITDIIKLKDETNKLQNKRKSLKNIVSYHRGAQEKLQELNTNYSGTGTKKPTQFLDSGTNKYDWWTKIKAYLPITYSDNLYEGTVNNTNLKITEPEAIKLLTRVIKAFEKIDETKFGVKFSASTHTSGTNHLPAIRKLAKDGLKDNLIIGKVNGQDHPDKGKPANHNKLNRVEYSFKAQFVADTHLISTPTATAFTPQTTEQITKTKIDNFFLFIDTISKDGSINPDFLTELNQDADILKNLENNTEWKVLPAQNTPLSEEKLTHYGIKPTDKDKTKLYLSETDLSKVQSFPIQNGLKSWIELIHSFFPTGSGQRIKLASSFQTDPYQDLLTAISDNTHQTNWELPEDKESLQEIVDQLEIEKINSAVQTANLDEQISKKTDQITEKETEIDKKVKEILTKKRAELAKFEIKEFDDKTSSGGKDERKTYWELWKLQKLLLEIRYLEKDGNTTLNSSVADENTALTEIESRLKIIYFGSDDPEHFKVWLVRHFIDNLSFKDGKNGDWNQAISKVKEDKDSLIAGDLNEYLNHFKEYEKLVKLSELEAAAKKALETELGKQPDETEKLTDWQTKLKELDPLLTETVITQTVMDDWQTQNNFKTLPKMKAELEKVFKDGKIETKFVELMKKEDAEVTDIAKLFTKKKAQEIITLIEYWDQYEKKDENSKKEIKQKIWWTLEKKDPKNDKKYLDQGEPTEKEIKDILYKVAVGEITLRDKKKEDENDNNSPQNDDKDKKEPLTGFASWYKFRSDNIAKPLLFYGGILAIVAGILTAIFWKQIKSWWSPEEEPEKEYTDISSDEEKDE